MQYANLSHSTQTFCVEFTDMYMHEFGCICKTKYDVVHYYIGGMLQCCAGANGKKRCCCGICCANPPKFTEGKCEWILMLVTLFMAVVVLGLSFQGTHICRLSISGASPPLNLIPHLFPYKFLGSSRVLVS